MTIYVVDAIRDFLISKASDGDEFAAEIVSLIESGELVVDRLEAKEINRVVVRYVDYKNEYLSKLNRNDEEDGINPVLERKAPYHKSDRGLGF